MAIESQGTVISIGQGDAATVLASVDEFDPLGEVKTFQGPGGSASVIDASHLGSAAREKLMGLADEGQFQLTLNRVFDDVGQTSAKTARADRELRHITVDYADGTTQSFTAFVLEFSTSGGVDQLVEGSITLEISGAVTEA